MKKDCKTWYKRYEYTASIKEWNFELKMCHAHNEKWKKRVSWKNRTTQWGKYYKAWKEGKITSAWEYWKPTLWNKRRWKEKNKKNEKDSWNQTQWQKSHQRNKHLHHKMLSTIPKINQGDTQINRQKDKKFDD